MADGCGTQLNLALQQAVYSAIYLCCV